MNSDSDITPGLGLPQPPAGPVQGPMPYASGMLQPPAAVAASQFDMAQPLPPVASIPSVPTVQQAFQPSVGQMEPPIPMAAPSFAQDVTTPHSDNDDALDLEWVGKAREVVERTHADPYLQSKELGRIKAQYIKARYNKDIKVSEEQQ